MRLAAILMFVLLTCCATDARLPEVGDEVSIKVLGPLHTLSYSGTITDIDESMIALNCTHIGKEYAGGNTDGHMTTPFDMCVGKGSITELFWLA